MSRTNIQKQWGVIDNKTELPQTRYGEKENSTETFELAKAKDQAQFLQAWNGLEKEVQDSDLNLKAFIHHESPTTILGVEHGEELNQRVLQYFGLKTGSSVNPWGWLDYSKRYSAYGA